MRTKAGIILGFVAGMAGFLLLFKLIILDRTTPGDELAPGIVVLASIVSGICFAYVGRAVQRAFTQR